MSWGYWVAIVLVLFLLGIGGMVYIAFQQQNEMLDDNYYEKELKYQGVIDGKNNLAAYNDTVEISQHGDSVRFRLPAPAVAGFKDGIIEFLRPSDMSKDTTLFLKPDATGIQWVQKSMFKNGLYHFRAKWVSSGKNYFDERNVVIK